MPRGRPRKKEDNPYMVEAGTTAGAVLEEFEQDPDASELEALGMELAQHARNRAKRGEIMDKIEALLTGLSDADMRAMAEHPVVLKFLDVRAATAPKKDDAPGTVYQFRGIPFSKKSWTEADLRKSQIPLVTFELDEAVDFVCWNGLRRSYGPGEHTDYACFYDLIRERKRQLRFAEEHKRFLLGEAPATHRDMLDPASMRVRATATGGSEYVASGSLDAVPMVEAEGD